MKVCIIDYGMGNLGSVRRALIELGVDPIIGTDPAELSNADRIILPGVGSFSDAMSNLVQGGWVDEIRRQVLDLEKPFLGICLGMQLLASRGCEHGDTEGLNLIPGEIVTLNSLGCDLRVPHVGWNQIETRNDHKLFAGIPDGTDFYFVHSFAFKPKGEGSVLAITDYGAPIVAAVGRGNVLGAQYHPEKSAKAGFRQLKNFLEYNVC